MRRVGALVVAAAWLVGACTSTTVPAVAPSGARGGTFHDVAYPGAEEQVTAWTATLTNERSTTWCVEQVTIGEEHLSLPEPACTAVPAPGDASNALAIGTSSRGEVFAFYAPGLLILGSSRVPQNGALSDGVIASEDRGFHLVAMAGDAGTITITMGTRDRSHVDEVVLTAA